MLVRLFVDENTYVRTKIYTDTVSVYGRGDETFIAEGAGISTRHLFLEKKKSFLPLARQVKRVSYSISYNIFISIFQYLAKFKISHIFPLAKQGNREPKH